MEIENLIDSRNSALWNKLKDIYEIDILQEDMNDYSLYSRNNKSVISIPFENLGSAGFTHELLHIQLRVNKVFIGAGIKSAIRDNNTLSKIFSEELLDHVGNCLDHIKMLPEFLRLGYKKEEFVTDFNLNKLSKEDIAEIKKYYFSTVLFKKFYNKKAIDFFIGKYFAVHACPNDTFNYIDRLKELKEIDTNLFQALDIFLNKWRNFDITDQDPITSNYHLLIIEFTDNLKRWANGKVIR